MSEPALDFAEDLERHHLWRNRLWRIFLVIAISILSGFVGEAYGSLVYGADEGDAYRGFRTGFTIGFISAAIEIYYIRSVRRSWIRRVAFLPGLIVRILVLTLIVRVGLKGNEALSNYLSGTPYFQQLDFVSELRDTLFSMGVVILFVVLSQLSAIIGWRRFAHLVFGRYFRPVVENRVFLLIDLVDSTRIARKLGNVRFHELLSDFFHQIDLAIVRTGGEVVSYVGDSVIVTWPLTEDRKKNARALNALLHMIAQLQRNTTLFESEFGEVPRFRAVMHCGEVVVGECGDSRRQVTFLGDVLNMTGRMEALAKAENVDLIASAAIVAKVAAPGLIEFEPLGERMIKGVDDPIDLYRIRVGKRTSEPLASGEQTNQKAALA